MSNTRQLKDQLIKSMNDEQLAKTIISMQMMSGLFSETDIERTIKEVCSRVHTTDPVLLALQDKIVKRFEELV